MKLEDITLVLGVDAQHLRELEWTWPTWMKFKPELLQMPAIVFYDPSQVTPEKDATFLHEHPQLRFVPWNWDLGYNQREKMITGWVHVPAAEVKTPWYLKLDTDAIATAPGKWLYDQWFEPDSSGRLPVFVAPPWGYSKPCYVIHLLDDWGDKINAVASYKRLNIPYTSTDKRIPHRRIISWFFLGRTDWTRKIAGLLKPDGRLPHPSQDTFLFYCAKRCRERYVIARMNDFGWEHRRLSFIRRFVRTLDSESEHKSAPVGGLAEKTEITGPKNEPPSVTTAKCGVIYYNTGTSCAARLLTSLFSLRQHYSGPVTILTEGEHSSNYCRQIGSALNADVVEWDCGIPEGTNRAYLAKTRYHDGTPYELTVALDSDTLVVGKIDELFTLTESAGFCVAQLGTWVSSGRIISKRIRAWEEWLLHEHIEAAINFGPAINCGVVSFRKDSTLYRDWEKYALQGRESFIPDEVCCQIMLPRYPHLIVDNKWNRSCKHDDPAKSDTRIIHYHGRKHCRPGLPYHALQWIEAFATVQDMNLANVNDWLPAGDRALRRFLRRERQFTQGPT